MIILKYILQDFIIVYRECGVIIILRSDLEHSNPLIKGNEAFDICTYSIVNCCAYTDRLHFNYTHGLHFSAYSYCV